MMKVTLCGSIAFYEQMLSVKTKLESMEHEVRLPPTEVPNEHGEMIPVAKYYELRKSVTDEKSWIWKRKTEAMRNHFEKVAWSDAILVCNFDKKSIKNHVGANTFLEIGLAFYLKKPIYFLNPIPEQDLKEELLGMTPIVINGDLKLIK